MTRRRSDEWVNGADQERRVIKAALEHGYTKLEARLLGLAERRGGVNFQTARECAADLDGVPKKRITNGRRESISRSWRNIADKGAVRLRRVYTGQKMPRAKWRSAYGSTIKALHHEALELKNPWTRAEKRRRQEEHARETKRAELREQLREEHDFVSRCPPGALEPTLVQELDADLAAVIEEARGAHERLSERRAAVGGLGRVPVFPTAAVRGPPE